MSQTRTPFGLHALSVLIAFVAVLGAACVHAAEERNRAPGFEALPREAKILVMPPDIELLQVSVGGVMEPKADWTEAAHKHFRSALHAKKKSLGVAGVELSERDADEVAEINTLHGVVARSIWLHHFGSSAAYLPTKEGKLDWSLGESVRLLKEKSGADFALFSWMRDTYASAERIAAAVVLVALVGFVLPPGGWQNGYASLVDLTSGRIVWFNFLTRGTGDLREPAKAAETVDALLARFPTAQ